MKNVFKESDMLLYKSNITSTIFEVGAESH